MSQSSTLSQFGWTAFFQQQLSLEQWQTGTVARVLACHRSCVEVFSSAEGLTSLPLMPNREPVTVGDWLLLDGQRRIDTVLERFSLFSRKAAGTRVDTQLIAANVNTVFVVCALNHNFNLSRIERYLVLAKEAGVEPVVVLSKADECVDVDSRVEQVRQLDGMLSVEAVNCLDSSSVQVLEPWCKTGQTIAFLGSSGVGKSTLINTLIGDLQLKTGTAREQDSRGRHTTTGRSIHLMPTGGLLLDTPGMRELQLSDCEQGVEQTFADIAELASKCRFSDCQHQGEPGCAVLKAIEAGQIDQRRLNNYRKLLREQARNSATLAEKHRQDRALHRYYRSVQKQALKKRGG